MSEIKDIAFSGDLLSVATRTIDCTSGSLQRRTAPLKVGLVLEAYLYTSFGDLREAAAIISQAKGSFANSERRRIIFKGSSVPTFLYRKFRSSLLPSSSCPFVRVTILALACTN